MAKIFSVASWNVEHFKDTTDVNRVKRVADFINGSNGGPAKVPDVFALFEVEGKYLYKEFMDKFPNHHFHMTEGKQTQEIFVGISNKLQSFVTQRLEFKEQRDFYAPDFYSQSERTILITLFYSFTQKVELTQKILDCVMPLYSMRST